MDYFLDLDYAIIVFKRNLLGLREIFSYLIVEGSKTAMSIEMARLIIKEMSLKEEIYNILLKNVKDLNREERREYYKYFYNKKRTIRKLIAGYYKEAPLPLKYRIVTHTVDSMFQKQGNPDIVDSIVMDAVGRMLVYKRLREKAEDEGVKFASLNNFHGTYYIIILIMVAIFIYFRAA